MIPSITQQPSNPMKPPADTDPDEKITLQVTRYGVNIYAGKIMEPQSDTHGKAVGYLTLNGESKPPGYEFRISVFPDGSKIGTPRVVHGSKKVELSINQSQLAGTMDILRNASEAYALYRIDGGVVHADVHGNYCRTNSPCPAEEPA
ncbi:MAG: hypothetical protein H7A49_12970 [Akkermansiaceae bacterium]|nr:hypothetical protein [Akkermansiaceae bacterium]